MIGRRLPQNVFHSVFVSGSIFCGRRVQKRKEACFAAVFLFFVKNYGKQVDKTDGEVYYCIK